MLRTGTRTALAAHRQDLCLGEGATEAAGRAGAPGAQAAPQARFCQVWPISARSGPSEQLGSCTQRQGWATSQLCAGPRRKPAGKEHWKESEEPLPPLPRGASL